MQELFYKIHPTKTNLGEWVEGLSACTAEVGAGGEVHLVGAHVEVLPREEPRGTSVLIGQSATGRKLVRPHWSVCNRPKISPSSLSVCTVQQAEN